MNQQTGAVLIIALIFLFVLTLIALSMFEAVALQSKMSGFFNNKMIACERAETQLKNCENDLLQHKVACATVIKNEPCHIVVYRVNVHAKLASTMCALQSDFAVAQKENQRCLRLHHLRVGQLLWRQMG